MESLSVLADPVRRRILEFLADGEQPSGNVSDLIMAEFRISQPAVSQHLKVLRDNNFANMRVKGSQRIYRVDPKPLKDLDQWLNKFRFFWEEKLDALETEIERGKKERFEK